MFGFGEAEDGGGGEAAGGEVGVGGVEEVVGGGGGVELVDDEGGGWAEGGVEAVEEGAEEVAELGREEVADGGADEDEGGEEGGYGFPVPHYLHCRAKVFARGVLAWDRGLWDFVGGGLNEVLSEFLKGNLCVVFLVEIIILHHKSQERRVGLF